MKKSFYSIGSIIILLFAALIFVLIPAVSGAGDAVRYPDYGSYNGRPVRFEENSDFYNAVSELISYYEQQGVDFNSEYASSFYTQIFSQAFQNVVGPYALEYFTHSTGYIVPDNAIDRGVRNLQKFQDETGTFSPAIYKAFPDSEKRKAFADVEKQLTQLRSYQDIFGSLEKIGNESLYGLKSSTAEADFIKKMGEKLYSFEVAAFDMKNYPDSEKIAFGTSHKDLFVQYNLKVISCDTESKAKEVLKRINNSEITFEDAITEYSTKHYGDAETGVLSANCKYQLSNAVVNESDIEKLTSLAKDSVSPVIETSSSYSIFKATDNPTEPDFTNETTIRQVYSYLLTREKSVIEDYYTSLAKDFSIKASTTSFAEAASQFDVATTSVAPFALNYNNTVLVGKSPMENDAILKYADSNENFYKTAFKLKKGETSSPVILNGANQVLVITCSDITDNPDSNEMTKDLIKSEIASASQSSINYSILTSDKIKDNSIEFMNAFNGNQR